MEARRVAQRWLRWGRMKFSRDRCVPEVVQSNLEFCKIPNHLFLLQNKMRVRYFRIRCRAFDGKETSNRCARRSVRKASSRSRSHQWTWISKRRFVTHCPKVRKERQEQIAFRLQEIAVELRKLNAFRRADGFEGLLRRAMHGRIAPPNLRRSTRF